MRRLIGGPSLASAFSFAALSFGTGSPAAAQQPGEVLWSFDAPAMNIPGEPVIAPDGTIYWSGENACLGGGGGLHALAPDGQPLWHFPHGGTNGIVSLGPDGTIYAGDIVEGGDPAIIALSPAGELQWTYVLSDGLTYGLIGGPSAGPDGNVYAVADAPGDFGYAFSLTSAGALRWQREGFSNNDGCPSSHLLFGGGHVIKVEKWTPIPAPGPFDPRSGTVGLALGDGALDWSLAHNVGQQFAGRQPALVPTTGHIVANDSSLIRTINPVDGSIVWSTTVGFPSHLGNPAAGSNGNIYASHGYTDVVALDDEGTILWAREDAVPFIWPTDVAVSPDGTKVAIAHTLSECSNGMLECAGGVVLLDAADGSALWSIILPEHAAGHPRPWDVPRFSPDGSRLYVVANVTSADGLNDFGVLYALHVGEPPRHGDLNGDGATQVSDLLMLLSAWGACSDSCAACDADLNTDCTVDVFDLLILLSDWG